MAHASESPKRPSGRGPGRPRTRPPTDYSPPQKKRKYIPGGPGGGGRYVDNDESITPRVTSASGAFGGRSRSSRSQRERAPLSARSPTATASRPRRDNRPAPTPRYNSAAEASVAMARDDSKPREEKGWEEYHPDLDIDADLTVFCADEVDGRVKPAELSEALQGINNDASRPSVNGYTQVQDENVVPIEVTPTLKMGTSQGDEDTVRVGNPLLITPVKKRPGRPPRRPDYMLSGLGSPPTPRIEPSQINNKDEKLKLTKAIFKTVQPFEIFEASKEHSAKNFVDRALSNVGYQETDRVPEPDRFIYVRGGEGSIEEGLDLALALRADDEANSSGALNTRAEYDMDEQDEKWLDEVNVRRKEDQVEVIRPGVFESTMTQIEKEWHALEKRIPKSVPKPPQTHRPRSSSAAAVNGEPGSGEEQDSKCAICDDGDCENTNAIVFCDGCDLAVHQECYGVPYIPEGQWLCRKCQLIGRGSPSCIFCPHEDGAFKQTNNSKWAHLLCAIWIPEVSLGNQAFMEPVMDVEKVPKQRWKLNCYICNQKTGACIQCGNKSCFAAFHVSCARKAKLYLKMKAQHGGPASLDASVLKAFCDRHVPSEWKREHNVPEAVEYAKWSFRDMFRGKRWSDAQNAALNAGNQQVAPQEEDIDDAADAKKRKRDKPQKNIWRLPSGAPIIPQVVYVKIEASLVRFNVRKRKEFAAEVCKYWTLKREARRGAALLKRLQLQLDTFTSMEITRRDFKAMGAAGRPRLQRRIEFAELLEQDMEKILQLCEKVMQREKQKLEDAEILRTIVDSVYFPIPPLLWPILEKAQILDAGPKDDGPKYFKNGLRDIQRKLEERSYTSILMFSNDLELVFAAAIGTDVPTSDIFSSGDVAVPPTLTTKQKDIKKVAKRINKGIQPAIEDAQRKEADLTGKPFEGELINLDAMLESNLRAVRHGSMLPSVTGESVDHPHEMDPTSPQKLLANGVTEDSHAAAIDSETVEAGPEAQLTDGDVNMEDAPELSADGEHPETIPIINTDPESSILNDKAATGSSTSSTVTAPALSASGSTNPSTHPPGPLTPPNQETDVHNEEPPAPLQQGGIPWYLEAFEPRGTTIHEERWVGRDVMRDMSEDLSEIDDDALEEMMDNEHADVDGKHVNGVNANGNLVPPNPQTTSKAAVKRKRRLR
ncbi:hypothetical protein NA57DRAFT_44156 [Rhizodiscina lignyota]|uniref:Uncharacterized protein n=1 Tax=Rhizodiscina lignyota TaxID=1504668 RepID=A0A9P4IC97_9PEZI|nr:hypothetical protein NA57DRAFT_44156 [Rhizodiscina lignyota]